VGSGRRRLRARRIRLRTIDSHVTAPADRDLVISVGANAQLRAASVVLMVYLAKFGHLLAWSQSSESRAIGVKSTRNVTGTERDQRVG